MFNIISILFVSPVSANANLFVWHVLYFGTPKFLCLMRRLHRLTSKPIVSFNFPFVSISTIAPFWYIYSSFPINKQKYFDFFCKTFLINNVQTIAHRLNTVLGMKMAKYFYQYIKTQSFSFFPSDYDRIIVLDAGRIVEFDSPKRLLET